MNRSTAIASLLYGSVAFAATGRAARASDAGRGLRPVLAGAPWLDGRPQASELNGRVVLVDVFTFECINCTRVVPNLKRLLAHYPRRDLAVVGVHTPEVPSYQSSAVYVEREARAQAISWPIVLDNRYEIWKTYGIDAWPTQLLFDRSGVLRARIVGDSNDAEVDARVAALVDHRS